MAGEERTVGKMLLLPQAEFVSQITENKWDVVSELEDCLIVSSKNKCSFLL